LLGAFLAGFWMGTRAGEDGFNTLLDAGKKVWASDEFKSTLLGATDMARGAIGQVLQPAREGGSGLRVA
ncbi:MAG: hypothetical protein ACRDTD_23010, partial [Pseudonocardiaceae bacterium]